MVDITQDTIFDRIVADAQEVRVWGIEVDDAGFVRFTISLVLTVDEWVKLGGRPRVGDRAIISLTDFHE